MFKKIVLPVSLVVAAIFTLANVAHAAREHSTDYMYLDEEGNTVGEGYLGCYGNLIVWGTKTDNYVITGTAKCYGN